MPQPTGRSRTQRLSEDGSLVDTFCFCRALYDFSSDDDSCVSFHKGDILEVISGLESGWWDVVRVGLRGWVPSNYLEIISDDEAQEAYHFGYVNLPHYEDVLEENRVRSMTISGDYGPSFRASHLPAQPPEGDVGGSLQLFEEPEPIPVAFEDTVAGALRRLEGLDPPMIHVSSRP